MCSRKYMTFWQSSSTLSVEQDWVLTTHGFMSQRTQTSYSFVSISHVPVALWCITCEDCLTSFEWQDFKQNSDQNCIKCYTFAHCFWTDCLPVAEMCLLQLTESQFSKKKLLLFCKMREGLRGLWEKYYKDKLFEVLKWLWCHKS